LIYAPLGCSIVVVQKQFMGIQLLIRKISEKNTSVIGSTHCINKAILYSGHDVRINEEVHNGFGGQIKVSVDFIL
jgi:hypothetical protein